jgi:hypothetical protein
MVLIVDYEMVNNDGESYDLANLDHEDYFYSM